MILDSLLTGVMLFSSFAIRTPNVQPNPDDYEDKASNIDYIEETPDLKEVTTDEEEFRQWEGIEEDCQELNRKNNPEINKKEGGG